MSDNNGTTTRVVYASQQNFFPYSNIYCYVGDDYAVRSTRADNAASTFPSCAARIFSALARGISNSSTFVASRRLGAGVGDDGVGGASEVYIVKRGNMRLLSGGEYVERCA